MSFQDPRQPPYPQQPQYEQPQQVQPQYEQAQYAQQWQQPVQQPQWHAAPHGVAPAMAAKRPTNAPGTIALVLLIVVTLGSLVQPLFMRYGYAMFGSAAYLVPNVLHYLLLIPALILAIVGVLSKRSPRHPIALTALGGAMFGLVGSILGQIGVWFAYSLFP